MPNPIRQWLKTAEEQAPKKVYWHFDDHKLTYGDFLQKVKRCQRWLGSLGANPLQRVLLLTELDRELLPLLFGAWSAGLTVAVVDAQATASEAAHFVRDVDPDFIITSKTSLFEGVEKKSGCTVVAIDVQQKKAGFLGKLLKQKSTEKETTYPAVLAQIEPVADVVGMPADSDALILFSSGTTGLPKGMVLSFDAIYNNITAISCRMGYQPSSCIHNALPLHHADGLLHGPVLALLRGASIVRSIPFAITSMERYVGEMFRQQITHLITVPTILAFIHKNREAFPGVFRWDGFQTVVSTAGPLDAHLWQKVENDFGVRLCNVYGLSETTIAATLCGPDDTNYQQGTVGTPLEGVEVMLAGDDGHAVGVGSQGEVCIRSNALFSRYLASSEATALVFRNGWLKTGDVGQLNADGTLSIVGRIKNIIVKGGENINPEEITARLLRCPGIVQAEVVGLPDAYFGETIAAAIVVDSKALSDAEIMAYCAAHLSAAKLPDYLLRFDALPYGPSGKVLCETLKQLCTEKLRKKTDDATAGGKIEELLFQIAGQVFKVPETSVSIKSVPGNTLGWDSLGHLNFVMAVEEHYGFQFTATEMMRLDSMAAFVGMTQQKLKGISG